MILETKKSFTNFLIKPRSLLFDTTFVRLTVLRSMTYRQGDYTSWIMGKEFFVDRLGEPIALSLVKVAKKQLSGCH